MITAIPVDMTNANVSKLPVIFGLAQSTEICHPVSYHSPVPPPRVLQLPRNTTITNSSLRVTQIHLGGETALGRVILDWLGENADMVGEHSPKERPHMTELSREERVRIAKGAFGMWADRQDLGDTVEYVTRLRASWERATEDPEID